MSWKKELLKGLADLKGEIARQQGIITTQDLAIQRQQAVIERLLDRIQAGSYKELKLTPTAEVKYDARAIAEFYEGGPEEDEDLAGMVVPVEGTDGTQGSNKE
jgi:hypothetical protein